MLLRLLLLLHLLLLPLASLLLRRMPLALPLLRLLRLPAGVILAPPAVGLGARGRVVVIGATKTRCACHRGDDWDCCRGCLAQPLHTGGRRGPGDAAFPAAPPRQGQLLLLWLLLLLHVEERLYGRNLCCVASYERLQLHYELRHRRKTDGGGLRGERGAEGTEQGIRHACMAGTRQCQLPVWPVCARETPGFNKQGGLPHASTKV